MENKHYEMVSRRHEMVKKTISDKTERYEPEMWLELTGRKNHYTVKTGADLHPVVNSYRKNYKSFNSLELLFQWAT